MAERRPLVLIDGEIRELPEGDTLPGGGGGWDPFGARSLETSSFTIVPNTFHVCEGSGIVATLPPGTAGDWAWLAQLGWGAEIQVACPSGVTMSSTSGPWTRNVFPAGEFYIYGTTSIILLCVETGVWMSVSGFLQ